MVMKILVRQFSGFWNKTWPFIAITLAVLIFFYPVWLKHLFPIPSDFIVGTYFPWLDYKWGTVTGVPVKNPITSDVVSIDYPLRIQAMDLIKYGQLPLWNDSMFAGFPMLANLQTAIFSPTIFLYFLLPNIWAWTGQVMLQPFLAAIFTYFLLRHFKLSKIASVFGGLAFAYSGFNLIWMEWNERTLVAAFIPLILLFVDKIILEKKFILSLFLSLFVALQFFSGYPQLMIYTVLAGSLLVVFRREEINLKVIGLFLFSAVFGFLLSSIQFFPAMELLANSQRGVETLSKDLAYLPWQNLIGFIAPDFFGNHVTANFWGVGNYTLNMGYSGVIVLIFAGIALFTFFKRTEVRYFLALILLSLLLTLPNPVSEFVWKSGYLGSSASSTTRVLILINLGFSALAAYSVDLFLSSKKSKIFPGLIFLFVSGVLFIFTYILMKNAGSEVLRNNYFTGIRNLILPSVYIFIASLLMVVRNIFVKNKRIRYSITFILIFISLFELFKFGWKYNPFSKMEYLFPETPVITYLKNLEKPNRILVGDVIPMNMWVPYGLESLSGYNASYPAAVAKYMSVSNNSNANASAQGTTGILTLYTSKFTDIANGQYLLLNNKNIQKQYRDLIDKKELIKVFSDGTVDIYKKSSALPRAIMVYRWDVLSSNEILRRLLDTSFDPAKEVVLEKDPGLKMDDIIGKYTLKYISYTSNESSIEIETNKPGVLFVSDTWYPGWNAYVDGNKANILKTDYAFRGVVIQSGSHVVKFLYNPESISLGMKMSIAAFLILVSIFVGKIFLLVKRRK